MLKNLLLLFSLLTFFHTYGQLTENFADGDFTANPVWNGDVSAYKVNTGFQLQLNASGEGIASLSTQQAQMPDMEWNFWIKLSFAPSDNNLARVYLTSDQQDLKASLNGYYVRFGETGSNDAIELVKQNGSTHTVVCRGADGLVAASFAVRVKVVRENGGSWQILADPTGGVNYQLQANGVDNSFPNGSFFGVYSKFTSSNSSKFYFDDFYAGPVVVDNTPPEVLSVALISDNSLSITFSEAVETLSSTSLTNYSVSPGGLTPTVATPDLNDPAKIQLAFNQNFVPDLAYTLTVSNVKDPAGNTMVSDQFSFAWHRVNTYDVVINEIMADPTPVVGLPDAEYVEIYNRSAFPADISGWTLELGSSKKPVPSYILPAGGFVILCDDGSAAQLESYGPVMAFSSFAVTNTAGVISLKDQNGNVIHSVSYSDQWYAGSYKFEGGWSLELIDPSNPCGEASNWAPCANETGGTPGAENSVKTLNPDEISPSISRVAPEDNTHITVWFTESCDSTALIEPTNYTIDNGIGNPSLVQAHSPDYKSVTLILTQPLQAGILYTLTSTTNITDCAGNQFLAGSSARFAIPSAVAANDIILNELLFDPVEGSVDFVEVYNRSNKVLDFRELVLANYDTVAQTFSSYHEISTVSYLILPGEYFVLSTDSVSIKKQYATINPGGFVVMESFPAMSNESGIVAICTKGGTVIDLASYTGSMHYPLLTNTEGISLERISADRKSNDPLNWHSAAEAVGFATPAFKNSQFATADNSDNEISLSPDIFSPDNDGYNDNLLITYTFDKPGFNATVTIYDASGRLVRNLITNELCGTSGTFSWDGITNERFKAAVGRYIVFIETFDLDGAVKKYKKSAVLGGKL